MSNVPRISRNKPPTKEVVARVAEEYKTRGPGQLRRAARAAGVPVEWVLRWKSEGVAAIAKKKRGEELDAHERGMRRAWKALKKAHKEYVAELEARIESLSRDLGPRETEQLKAAFQRGDLEYARSSALATQFLATLTLLQLSSHKKGGE